MIWFLLYTLDIILFIQRQCAWIELTPDLLAARLHSSVGRASYRYCGGHGFKNPIGGSEFFLGFICNCYFTTAKISFTSSLLTNCPSSTAIIEWSRAFSLTVYNLDAGVASTFCLKKIHQLDWDEKGEQLPNHKASKPCIEALKKCGQMVETCWVVLEFL